MLRVQAFPKGCQDFTAHATSVEEVAVCLSVKRPLGISTVYREAHVIVLLVGLLLYELNLERN